ncbi:rod shape-determining protein MreC [Pelotomaculum propionicicum]|uniref:rod shape-determining protein MreC n=1 Tax=Pelotomaculum propionicicum TaxID=258475 RepID=UPI003B7BE3CC
MRWVTAKRLFLLAVLVAVTLAAMRFTVPERTRLTSLESKFRDMLAPVQTGLTWVGRQGRYIISLPVSMVGAAARSQALEQEVERLESEKIQYNEYLIENQRLSALLDYKKVVAKDYNFVIASVIGRDPGNWFGTLTLNRGSSEGIKENMSVLTPDGLVGRVIAVSDFTCEVLLITDPRSGVGSLVQDTRTPGIVEGIAGTSGIARMIHIPNNAPVEAGQAVVTSGQGSVFPKGIPVGRINSIQNEPSGLFLSAEISPFANLNSLEEVMIVTFVQPEATTPRVGG